jgi:type II secretory pathway component GspD/PulD (secretin)
MCLVAVAAMMVAACGTNRSFRRGEEAARAGDWDAAVQYYRRAVQENPDRPEHKIALERAQEAASIAHTKRAKDLEEKNDLEGAIAEYKRAVEFHPANRQASHRRTELERVVRDKAEASRIPPAVEAMRARARQQTVPDLNPASPTPLKMVMNELSPIDALSFIAASAGINIVYEPTYKQHAQNKPITLNVSDLSLQEALNLVMTMSQSWFKVINSRTIFVMPDTPQMRQKYEEQVVRTFYLSHADATEVNQIVSQVGRLQTAGAAQIVSLPNKTANTLTVRASAAIVNIIEKVIMANDRPRAEVVVDVEMLEVSRDRAKELGLNLSDYQIGTIFSPEGRPGGSSGTGDGGTDDGGTTGGGGETGGTNPFNLLTISRGISMADFYMTVPSAVFRFLATDSHTRLLAKPQLRGAEGEELTLEIGEEVPIPRTTFGGVAAGGINTVPIQSFDYRPIGIIVKMKPRVTFENEVVLDISVENSTLLGNLTVAGQSLPSFGSRKVKTRMRLREGESNMLAGLLREDERRSLTGFPGLLRVPILKDLLGSSNDSIRSTDIVMLLTPRIVRTHELTQEHLNPIHIGSASNVGLTGPAPVIAAPPEDLAPAPAAVGPQPPPPGGIPPAPQPVAPLGTTSTPGMPPVQPNSQPVPSTSTPGQQPPPGFNPYPQSPQSPAATPYNPTQPPAGATGPGTPAGTGARPAGAPSSPTTPGEAPGAVPPRDAAPALQTGPGAVPGQQAAPAQIVVTTPGPEFRVGGGPYTVPISVTAASRMSVVSVSLTYNPAVLRVRNVQDGTFMKQGGINAQFSNKAEPGSGRVDITITRAGDSTGASGTGLLAAVLFDAIAPGGSTLSVSGVATGPDGAAVPLSFVPATITAR